MTENESIPGDKSIIEGESTLDDNRTIEEEGPTDAAGFTDKTGMSSPEQATSPLVEAQLTAGRTTTPTRQRNVSRIVLYAVFLVAGFVLGVVAVLLFELSIGGNKSPLPAPSPVVQSGNVTVHAGASIITPLLQNSVQQIDLPANGSVSNVQVQFTNGSEMTMTGNYQVSLFGVPVTTPFTLDTQLVVNNCQLQLRVLHADFSNISITGLVSLFEDKINQKLAQLNPQKSLPSNVELCLINLATDIQGLTATFDLVIPSSPTPTANVSKPIALL